MLQSYHPQKGPFVRDLRPGDRVTGFYLCRHKRLEPFRDRSRGQFLTLILGDRTGQILARVWEGAEELVDSFEESDVLKVAGDVEEYLGRAQIIVHKLRRAEEGEYDLRDFLPASEKDPEAMLAALRETVDRIVEPHLSALVRSFYDDPNFLRQLAQAPAARRVHHAYLGGLLDYLVEVATLCESALALYAEIDADLLRAGALLHGVGKLREFVWEKDILYSDEGRLIGHVVVGEELVTQAIQQLPDFPEELSLRVRHMMLSQRGRYEYGSPRRPMTLEAIALHKIVDLSVQINRFQRLLTQRRDPESAWTDYDRLLGHSLYLGKGDDDLSIEEQSLED